MPNDVRAAVEHVLGRGPAPKVAPRPQPEAAQQPKQPSDNAGHPITVSEANFEQQVLHSDEPVLVDFWAPWCGPCRMVAPTLEKLGKEYAGKIKVAKLNVDDNQRLAMKYGARSIPLLVMFKNGKPVQQLVGAHPEPNIRGMIERTIS